MHCLHILLQPAPGGDEGYRQGSLLPAGLFDAVEDAFRFMSASCLLPPSAFGGELASLRCDMEAQASRSFDRDTASFPMSVREQRLVESIEAVMHFKFRNKFLAVQAVTHCSYQSVSWDSYQRQVLGSRRAPFLPHKFLRSAAMQTPPHSPTIPVLILLQARVHRGCRVGIDRNCLCAAKRVSGLHAVPCLLTASC